MEFSRVGGLLVLLAFVTGLFLCVPARADRLVLKSGQIMQGRVLSEQDEQVVFEVIVGDVRVKRNFDKAEIDRLIREEVVEQDPAPSSEITVAPDASRVFVLPIVGMIGKQVTADNVRRSLQKASTLQLHALVLDIDSGGGFVDEQLAITDAIVEWRAEHRVRTIAWVSGKAYSAAAVIAMAAPEIYMAPSSVIGAAAVVDKSRYYFPWGYGVDEKTASVLRAKDRMVCESANHNAMILQAMSDQLVTLYLARDAQNQPVLAFAENGIKPRALPEYQAPFRQLKGYGQLLSLTAGEAVECGLSQGTANSMADLFSQAKLDKAQEVHSLGRDLHRNQSNHAKRIEADVERIRNLIGRQQASTYGSSASIDEAVARKGELRAIRGSLERIVQIHEENRWAREEIGSTLGSRNDIQQRIVGIERSIASIDDWIELEKKRNKKPKQSIPVGVPR
jgi:membrane-bound ClpP family serine protease